MTLNSFSHKIRLINFSAKRTNSDKYQTKQLNAVNSTHAHNYNSAFCLYSSNFQPPSLFHLNSHNSKHIIPHQNLQQSTVNTKPQGLSQKTNSINSISLKNLKNFPRDIKLSKSSLGVDRK